MTTPTYAHDIIATAIADACTYLADAMRPSFNSHTKTWEIFHDGGDDTDYQPAAADFISMLTYLYNEDDPAYDAFFAKLEACEALDDNFSPCYHIAAIDFHHVLEPFIPTICRHDESNEQ